MQVGGERLGRAGIEVAGEVRQGSEAKGNAGRVEVRQARRVRAGYGRVWKVPYWIDQVRQARSV